MIGSWTATHVRVGAALGGGLHHGVVDADLRQLRVDLGQSVGLGGQLGDQAVGVRQQLAELVEHRARLPDEHAGVPPVVARVQVALGGRPVGLLLEREHPTHVRVARDRLAPVQVAVPRVSGGRHDAERHQRARVGLGDLETLAQRLLEGGGGSHDVVGGDHRHHGVGIALGQHGRRPGDGVHRVATLGLTEDVAGIELGQLGGHHVGVVRPGADPDLLGFHHAFQPLVREPQQTLTAEDAEQLLGHIPT